MPTTGTPEVIGVSRESERMRAFAKRAAESEHTLLLRGETGTGKDHLAELIHALGSGGCPKRPFVLVDCGALTESLSESELFGHARGAFTGADKDNPGLVRQAEGGTLFLNEIANMSLSLQAKFLRLLDKKNFRAVGGTQEFPVQARLIASTNADLEALVRQREFREDLFHRLDVVSFTISPLRERKEDIPCLAEAFLRETAQKEFSAFALSLLSGYPWPGNVRELKNSVIRASFRAENETRIGAEHILFSNTGAGVGANFSVGGGGKGLPTWKEVEERYLRTLFDRAGGNASETARLSGLCRRTVDKKIRKYGLRSRER